MPVYTSTNGVEAVEYSITILKGAGLAAKDRNMMGQRTTSDPYCQVELLTTLPPVGRKKNPTVTQSLGQTPTVMKTCDPEWNHALKTISVAGAALGNADKPPCLQLKLFDYDKGSDDDAMGTVTVPLPTGAQSVHTKEWYDVDKKSANNAKGKLQVEIKTTVYAATQLQRGNAFVLDTTNKVRIGLAWDVEKGKAIDLDAACVALKKDGNVAMDDCVYYGNLTNSNQSVVHSGDEREGNAEGEDESMSFQLDKIPSHVLCMYIILTVASVKRTLSHITSAKVTLIDETKPTTAAGTMAVFSPANHVSSSDATAMFLLRMARHGDSGRWKVQPMEDTHPTARDFGSLIPHLKSYTRDLVPDIHMDPTERCSVMRKGGNIHIKDFTPTHTLPSKVTFGLAWDMNRSAKGSGKKNEKIDLDASAICLNGDLKLVEYVWYKQLTNDNESIKHGGDQRSGKAAGDDECIYVELPKVHKDVKYIGFVVNSYSGQELDDITKASCHLFDTDTGADIANHAISDCKFLDGHTALLMGCLYRVKNRKDKTDEWCLRIISQAADGKNVKDIVTNFMEYLEHNPCSAPMENDVGAAAEAVIGATMPPEVPIP